MRKYLVEIWVKSINTIAQYKSVEYLHNTQYVVFIPLLLYLTNIQ